MSDLTVSIVVCSTGREERLNSLLDNEELQHARELVIVAESEFPTRDGITVIQNTRDGLPGARNTGLAETSGDIIAFIDDDFHPSEGWFEAIKKTFEGDSGVIAVGGPSILSAPDWEPTRNQTGTISIDKSLRVTDDSYQWIPEDPEPVPTLPGSNMSFRRSAIDGLRFDEDLQGTYYREETDFILRLRKENPEGQVIYHPRVKGDHIRTYSGGCSLDNYEYWEAYNQAYFVKKHAGLVSPLLLLIHLLDVSADSMSNPPSLPEMISSRNVKPLWGYIRGLFN